MATKRHLKKKTVNKNHKKVNLTKKIRKQKLKKTRINKLVGGTVHSKIMICTRNEYTYLIPVLEYLERTYDFMKPHIDIIYANNTFLPKLNFPATLNLSQLKPNKPKPEAIFFEAIQMGTHPFIIYIDDENEIIKNNYGKTFFDSKIKEEFYFELYSYNEREPKSYEKIEMSNITEDMKKNPENLMLLKKIIKSSQIPANSGLCLCIQLPHEDTSICDASFFEQIQNILSFINKKFNNNLLTVFDFDNTLTKLHLYKSIVKKMDKYSEYNERDFNDAFLQDSNDVLKEAQIVKYFGANNIEKIKSLFQIVKSIEQPANSNNAPPVDPLLLRLDSPKQNLENFLNHKIAKDKQLILSFCDCKIILVYIVYYNLLGQEEQASLIDLINTKPVKGNGTGASNENIKFINKILAIIKILFPELRISGKLGVSSCSSYALISVYLTSVSNLYHILFKSFEDEDKKSIYDKLDELFLSSGVVIKSITLDDITKLFTNVKKNNAAPPASRPVYTQKIKLYTNPNNLYGTFV
jgi:hypothetical protein